MKFFHMISLTCRKKFILAAQGVTPQAGQLGNPKTPIKQYISTQK